MSLCAFHNTVRYFHSGWGEVYDKDLNDSVFVGLPFVWAAEAGKWSWSHRTGRAPGEFQLTSATQPHGSWPVSQSFPQLTRNCSKPEIYVTVMNEDKSSVHLSWFKCMTQHGASLLVVEMTHASLASSPSTDIYPQFAQVSVSCLLNHQPRPALRLPLSRHLRQQAKLHGNQSLTLWASSIKNVRCFCDYFLDVSLTRAIGAGGYWWQQVRLGLSVVRLHRPSEEQLMWDVLKK